MNMLEQKEKETSKGVYTFLIIVVFLTLIGIISMYSASYNKALKLGFSGNYFLVRQTVFVLFGLVIAVILQYIPFSFMRKMIPLLILLSFVLMILTRFTSLGETRMGAKRWLQIGPLSFQPSEIVKISMILFLANYFDKNKKNLQIFYYSLYPMLIVLVFAGLILIQKDFSTTVLFLFICLSIFLAAGVKFSYLLYMFLFLGIPGILLLVTQSYRLKRVIGFLFKDIDPSGINYQVNTSLSAIKSGGLFGKGLGQGMYKLGLIPEVQSDFVFASFAEEMGLMGVFLVCILFFLYGFLGYLGALRLRKTDPFLFFTGFGSTSMVIWQALLNLAVVCGLVPPTGVPLPFFSQGGTNIAIIICISGLIIKIMREIVPSSELDQQFFEISKVVSYD